MRRGDASVSQSQEREITMQQTWFDRLLSQDDQKVSRKKMYAVNKSVFNRVDYFQADQARLHARDGSRLTQYLRLFVLLDSGQIDSPSLLVCHALGKQ